MKSSFHLGLFLALMLSIAATASAQQPDSTDAAASAKPKAAAFDVVFGKWKEILTELRYLRIEYRKTGAKDVQKRAEISKQYDELVARGERMQDGLVEAAIEAYKEAPNQDMGVTQFLLELLAWHCDHDNYEKAIGLGDLLIEHKLPSPATHGLAGKAAFAVNDFDKAETYLKNVGADSALSKESQGHLMLVPYYKKEWAKEREIRQAEAKADDLPRVVVTIEAGEIEIELFENEAPNTVANFVSLVNKGFYDGLTFHRVLPGFMAQGGCPQGTGGGGPGYRIECECTRPDHRKHFRGSLSMAHAGPDTGGSQFFLTFMPTQQLDGRHTVFGRVIRGIELLAEIQRIDPEKKSSIEPEKIIKMEVVRSREHEYKPKTMAP